MTNTDDWHEWPQIQFDIDLYDDVSDWVINRFGEDTKEVILTEKNGSYFYIAIQDPRVLDVALLKFTCSLHPCHTERMRLYNIEHAKIDAEIKRLTTELQKKITSTPILNNYVKEAARDVLLSYNDGVWTNVEN